MRRSLLACLFAVLLACGARPSKGPLAPGEHAVFLNGVRLWYRVAGQAQPEQAPLVYLAGGPGYTTYSFEKTIGSQLEKHTQLIYFDQRGTGRSERPRTGNYALPTLVEDIETLRRHLGADQLSLMGHSFGATVAVEYAARYPEHVRKLIVVDGAEDMPRIFALWAEEIRQRYSALWAKTLAGQDGRALQSTREKQDACAISQASFKAEMAVLGQVDGSAFHNWQQFHDQRYQKQQADLDQESGLRNTGEVSRAYFSPGALFVCYQFKDYSRLTMPTLVIAGKYDGAVGFEPMREFADRLPNARFDEFPNSAHFPYAEEPAKFSSDVAAFVSER